MTTTTLLKDLDLAVALLEGWELDPLRPEEERQIRRHYLHIPSYDLNYYTRHGEYQYTIAGVGYVPTINWNQGGPIVEKEGICIMKGSIDNDFYEPLLEHGEITASKNSGKTFLEAAMRAYIDKYESLDVNNFNIQKLTQKKWYTLIESLLDPESIEFYHYYPFLFCSCALGLTNSLSTEFSDDGYLVLNESYDEIMTRINFVRQKKEEGFSFVDSINLYFKDNPSTDPTLLLLHN